MNRWQAGFLAAVMLAAGTAGSCAKKPTVVLTTINVDSSVAPLRILGVTVVSQDDPTHAVLKSFVSLARGDAADRPAPYRFPLDMSLSVPAPIAGPVTITIEGLDWDTDTVIARGTTNAQVISEQHTRAAVTLTSVNTGGTGGMGGPDGGGDAGGANDMSDAGDGTADLGRLDSGTDL